MKGKHHVIEVVTRLVNESGNIVLCYPFVIIL